MKMENLLRNFGIELNFPAFPDDNLFFLLDIELFLNALK
jgi:hypothetical protein